MNAVTDQPRLLRHDARVIGLVGVAHATSHFFHLILAPLFPWLKEAFSLSYAQLGLLMTVFFIVSAIGQALAGFIVDRVGALPVHLIGLGLLCLSAVGLASSQSYAALLFFEGIAGLGNSVFHPSGFTILNHRVSVPRLGHAFSVHGITGTLGWAVAPVFLAGLAAAASWRSALLAAASLAFLVLVLLAFYRDDLHTDQRAPTDGSPLPSVDGKARSALLSVTEILVLPGVWMCFAFFLITALSNGGIQSFAALALQEIYALPVSLASACVTAYMLANAGGMVMGGFLAARTTHHERIIAFAFAGAGLTSLVVASGAVPGNLGIVLLSLIGVGSGIAGPSRDLLIRAAAPKGATGRVYGVVYSGLDIGLSIAPILYGALMDAHHSRAVFVLVGAFQSVALITGLGIGGNSARRREKTG